MIGTGMSMIIKSVKTSVAVKTVSILSVLEHCVRKIMIGAQFQVHLVPHWKRVAKKNAIDQATINQIIIEQNIEKDRTRPNSRFQRKRIDSLISPNAIFSVV
jgi:hypothetical protein